jgi:hypothetical protein
MAVTDMIKRGGAITSKLDLKLSLAGLYKHNKDSSYYSLAVQAGYLTFVKTGGSESEDCELFIPNKDLAMEWSTQIIDTYVSTPGNSLNEIFSCINETCEFSEKLSEYVSYRLSYFNTNSNFIELIYHVFIYGMVLTLGYECSSDKESGNGRHDIRMEAPGYIAYMEFKSADSEERLDETLDRAINQIDERKYYIEDLRKKNKPIFKIGLSFYKKICKVKTVEL